MASRFERALAVISRRGGGGRGRLDAHELRSLEEMRTRLERLRDLSAEFSAVELSPYVRSLLGEPQKRVREPARRAAGI